MKMKNHEIDEKKPRMKVSSTPSSSSSSGENESKSNQGKGEDPKVFRFKDVHHFF